MGRDGMRRLRAAGGCAAVAVCLLVLRGEVATREQRAGLADTHVPPPQGPSATLFRGDRCTGDSVTFGGRDGESRCRACFDTCDKYWPSGGWMHQGGPGVRSVRVSGAGAVLLAAEPCVGGYGGYKLKPAVLARESDGCVRTASQAHFRLRGDGPRPAASLPPRSEGDRCTTPGDVPADAERAGEDAEVDPPGVDHQGRPWMEPRDPDNECAEAVRQQRRRHPLQTQRPRIFGLVLASYPRGWDAVLAVEETWGRWVDTLRFAVPAADLDGVPAARRVSPRGDPRFLAVPVRRPSQREWEGRLPGPGRYTHKNTWEATWRSVLAVAQRHLADADWFAKADLDTWLGVENLRAMVAYLPPDRPAYLGHPLLHHWKSEDVVLNSGAGYVLSRGALRRVGGLLQAVADGRAGGSPCRDREGWGEDVGLAVCLREVGVRPSNTAEADGAERFLPFTDADHRKLRRPKPQWFWAHKPLWAGEGDRCCSAALVVVHGLKSSAKAQMEDLESRFHAALEGGSRLSEPPDQGLFRYDEASITFATDGSIPPHSLERRPTGADFQSRVAGCAAALREHNGTLPWHVHRSIPRGPSGEWCP